MKRPWRGAGWEALAERYLAARGLRTVKRNFHCRFGEVDLVMQDGAAIVFVEVRYRHDLRFGTPAESVHRGKQLKIRRAAGIFLAHRPALAHHPCRFDVVGISGPARRPRIEWLRAAFDAG